MSNAEGEPDRTLAMEVTKTGRVTYGNSFADQSKRWKAIH